MKRKSLSALICCMITFVGLPCTTVLHSELIEPTRTLDARYSQPGMLSIYSEPPSLEFLLDEKPTGRTPMISIPVPPGEHTLRIGDQEERIYLAPGQTVTLSWFKNAWIRIHEQPPASAPEGRTDSTQMSSAPRAAGEAKKPWAGSTDPFYWPLNPRGPIY